MPKDTANIVGTTGASFDITSGGVAIANAFLEVQGKQKVALTISGDAQSATVPNLPAGDSMVRLDLAWVDGDQNTLVGVANVTTGTAAVNIPDVLIVGNTPSFVTLFGA